MPTTRPIESLETRQMLAAATYDWTAATIKANGFIDGIVYHPTARDLAYIHTDMGGAYRYDASRARWTPLNDFSKYTDAAAKHMGVETLAIDPTDPDRVYMGIGTYMQNSAVLRSTDRGQTFQRADVPFQMNGNGSGRNAGERMRVDPNSPNILFYGSRDDGLWKSSDRAATWTRVASFPTVGLDSGFGQDTGILFVEFDKSSSAAGTPTQTIYAGVFDPTAGATRIFRSTDAGATWAALPGGQPTPANLFPQRAALTPDGSALYITYASSTSYPGPYGVGDGNVYKVTNPGSATPAWADVSPPVNYAFSAVTLDPTAPNTVYVSEMGNYNPADRIWRSTNGGANWTVISPNSNRDDTSAPYASSSKVHWLGDLQIDPMNRDVAMFTTGYGLYRTTNLTANNPRWTFFNEGFEQSAVLEFASPNGGPVNLISAIGDRDGYRHTDFAQSPTLGVLGANTGMARGTSPDIDVAWNDPNVLVRVTQSAPYVQVSTNNGVNWTWLSSTGVTGGNGGRTALSGDGNRVIYEPGGTGNRLLYATRTGNAWSGWTAPATGQPADGADLVADLVEPNTFYAQTGRTISRSTDGGVNWTVMTTTAPNGIGWVRAVPDNAGHMIASAGGNGVYRTTNAGATWTRLAASAVTDAYAAGVGAAKPGTAYPALYVAGTVSGQTGFHRSDDAGATWVTISDDQHQYGQVIVIQGDPRVYGRLYVGSNGRGILVGEPISTPSTLPTGWRRDDVGAPALAGQSGAVGDDFTLAGNGTGLAAAFDQFHLVSTAAGGDATITARVNDLARTSANARAGVTIRADASPSAAFAMLAVRPDGKVVFTWRETSGSNLQTGVAVGTYANAKYLRLARVGGTVVPSYSEDGVNWIAAAAPATVALPQVARAGLAAVSASTSLLAKANFADVSVVSDTVAPSVVTSAFDYRAAAAPAVVVRFSEDVSASLDAADLFVGGGDASVSAVGVTFDTATFEARFALPAGLAIGDYVAAIADGAVTDAAGNPVTAATNLEFFHLPGDVNRDRAVGFSDLVILAQNYGQSGAFEQGDLNASGTVGFEDLVTLAQNYGRSLALPTAAASAATRSGAATSSAVAGPAAASRTKRGRVADGVL